MGTQKGRLFELAEAYHSYQKKKHADQRNPKQTKKTIAAEGQHFDEGKSINLSYSVDMYPEKLYDSHQRSAMQMSFYGDGRSEAFFVEPFEADDTVAATYEISGEENPLLERIAKGLSATNDEQEDLQEDEDKLGELSKKIDKMLEPADDDASAMGLGMMHSSMTQDTPPTVKTEKPDLPSSTITAVTDPYDTSDEEFAKDIGAILQGQKLYDATQKKAVDKNDLKLPAPGRSDRPSANDGPSSKDEMLDPNKNEHKIFEKIAQSMTYANSYDLGSISLAEKFDILEQEIAKDDVSHILHAKPSNKSDEVSVQDAQVVEEQSAAFQAANYQSGAPLYQSNGGRMIKADQLQRGDLILSSSSNGIFDTMDGQVASDSIAGVYAGGGKVLTKGDAGTLEEKDLQSHLGNKGVMAVLRHQNINDERGTSIINALTKFRVASETSGPDPWLKIRCASVAPHADVCNEVKPSDKQHCLSYNGKIFLGTLTNDAFLCSESIINAFEKNKVGFVPPLSQEHNGALKYFGHLKNK